MRNRTVHWKRVGILFLAIIAAAIAYPIGAAVLLRDITNSNAFDKIMAWFLGIILEMAAVLVVGLAYTLYAVGTVVPPRLFNYFFPKKPRDRQAK